MIDSPAPIPAPPSPSVFSDERQMAMIIYILYLAGLATGVAAVVGLILAYVNRNGAPEWLRSHYTFQIRTFWIGILYFCISCACFIIFLLGVPMLGVVTLWFVARCALGINRLMKMEAYPTPESWTI